MIKDMNIMNSGDTIFFKVNDNDRKKQEEEIIPYWEKSALRNKMLNNLGEEWKKCYGAGIFTEFMEQRGPGHTVGGDVFYRKGFLDLKEQSFN